MSKPIYLALFSLVLFSSLLYAEELPQYNTTCSFGIGSYINDTYYAYTYDQSDNIMVQTAQKEATLIWEVSAYGNWSDLSSNITADVIDDCTPSGGIHSLYPNTTIQTYNVNGSTYSTIDFIWQFSTGPNTTYCTISTEVVGINGSGNYCTVPTLSIHSFHELDVWSKQDYFLYKQILTQNQELQEQIKSSSTSLLYQYMAIVVTIFVSLISLAVSIYIAVGQITHNRKLMKDQLNYTWQRDQALDNNKRIYEPCYNEILFLSDFMDQFCLLIIPNPDTTVSGWSNMRSTHLATVLNATDKELYDKLIQFYGLVDHNIDANIRKGWAIIKGIAMEEFGKSWKKKLQAGINKEEVTKNMIERFFFSSNDFLPGKLIQGQGLLDAFMQVYKWDKEKSFEELHRIFANEEKMGFMVSEKVLGKISDRIQNSQEIVEVKERHLKYIKMANELKEILKERVTKPYLIK